MERAKSASSRRRDRSRRRRDLRAYVVERSSGLCEWPSCRERGREMAHLEAIGMGGRESADRRENVALLCQPHHDMLDGRRSYDPDAIRSLTLRMPFTFDESCRWPTCTRDDFESGFCYPHLLLTDPVRIDSTRRFEFAIALASIL